MQKQMESNECLNAVVGQAIATSLIESTSSNKKKKNSIDLMNEGESCNTTTTTLNDVNLILSQEVIDGNEWNEEEKDELKLVAILDKMTARLRQVEGCEDAAKKSNICLSVVSKFMREFKVPKVELCEVAINRIQKKVR